MPLNIGDGTNVGAPVEVTRKQPEVTKVKNPILRKPNTSLDNPEAIATRIRMQKRKVSCVLPGDFRYLLGVGT